MVRTHKKKDYENLEKYTPMLFCVNDSEYTTNNDRIKAKEMLAKRFPKKSQYEK